MYKLKNFSKVKILVIGDVMIDKYLWGEVTRISPEAPVPVVNLKKTGYIAGGAANVAANVAGLGAAAYLIGVVGNDAEGQLLGRILSDANVSADYIVKIANRKTTVKTRIIAHSQQIARIDHETLDELVEDEESKVWQMVLRTAEEVNVIIVSDYGKGLLSVSLLSRLISYAKEHQKILMVDPKGRDYSKYRGATIITPNKSEIAEVCGCRTPFDGRELEDAGRRLLSELELKAVIITRGEEGMTLIEKNKKPLTLRSVGRKVYDVTGAGDTFISALATAAGAGESFRTAAKIANTAAGLAVEGVGTTVIKYNDLSEILQKMD